MNWKRILPYLIAALVGEAVAAAVSLAKSEWNPHVHAVLILFAVVIYAWRGRGPWTPDFGSDHDHGAVGAAIMVVIGALAALLTFIRRRGGPST